MTIRDKYKELYGVEPDIVNDCPSDFRLGHGIDKCSSTYKPDTCKTCWDREYVEPVTNAPAETAPAADNVNHPSHYADGCSLECIQVMGMIFGKQNTSMYALINAFKYMWRWKHKNGQEDLRKAEWYLNYYKENHIFNDCEKVYFMLTDILKEVKDAD